MILKIITSKTELLKPLTFNIVEWCPVDYNDIGIAIFDKEEQKAFVNKMQDHSIKVCHLDNGLIILGAPKRFSYSTKEEILILNYS